MPTHVAGSDWFVGEYYCGRGDTEYIQLLDIARRMFDPDPEFQNMPMLYTPAWNGFVEGPTWGAWWIQNSYGPTYCALPFWLEPYTTFIQNSQDLWFDQMGDGVREGGGDWHWVAPDGCLCDAAAPGWIYYKQGDGRVDIHDWGMEFTAAGVVLQAELLLISRDPDKIAHYLPMLERSANFIESRRDPKNNLFLAGPAANLLAPSYAGWKRPDGTFGMAYLTGLCVTYIAALDRLIELEKLAGNPDKALLYAERRDRAREGLTKLTTEEGYLIKSLDPDGTRHGVYGAEKHGYFEAVCNHDAICFRVVGDEQAEAIYQKIAAIPGLRPHDLIITNYPSLDDMYVEPDNWLWAFGTWVNGGHWTTCEARMMMAYSRLGKYEDARRAMLKILDYARRFRMDNPLVDFGGNVYQPNLPINCVYDAWGAPAALIRGLFEYLYQADGLTLIPHIPPGITALRQDFPIRFGTKRLYLSTQGSGPITAVFVNGEPWTRMDPVSVFLPYEVTPDEARVHIILGHAKELVPWPAKRERKSARDESDSPSWLATLDAQAAALASFVAAMEAENLGGRYEAAHARLAVEYVAVIHERRALQAAGMLAPLSDEASQAAADQSYVDTANRLCEGLSRAVRRLAASEDPVEQHVYQLWRQHGLAPVWSNIRAEAVQSFVRQGDAMRMTINGNDGASCGWALDLEPPVELPPGAQLMLELSGSPGSRFFVDLMTPEEGIIFQTLWQETPTEPRTVTFDLPAGPTVGRVILYTMTRGGEAYNDFRSVQITAAGQEPLIRVITAAP